MHSKKWKDESRGGKIVWSNIYIGKQKLSVHHYIGCGDSWFVSGPFLDRFYLKSETLNQAKREALELLRSKLQEIIDDVNTATEANTPEPTPPGTESDGG